MSAAPLHGLVTIVTGASSGIGAELARQAAAAGAKLVLAARDTERLASVASACRDAGADAIVVPTDVTDEARCAALVERAVAHYGRLDVLIANAGISTIGAFADTTDLSVFERTMRVNYLGAVWCTAHALPHLARTRGRIVAVASLAGLTGVPRGSAYAATKHAMAGFFDSIRMELADQGVSVTVVYPGFVFSEINQRALGTDGQPLGERGYRRPTQGTMATDECARLILGATARRDRDLVMTWRGKVGRVVKGIAPGLIDRVARRMTRARR